MNLLSTSFQRFGDSQQTVDPKTTMSRKVFPKTCHCNITNQSNGNGNANIPLPWTNQDPHRSTAFNVGFEVLLVVVSYYCSYFRVLMSLQAKLPRSLTDSDSSTNFVIRTTVLILLCCQNAGHALLTRYSQGILNESYSSTGYNLFLIDLGL